MTHFDLIVVGSGAGGLTAASLAARKGWSVLVLEAAPLAGGYLNTYDIKGYRFDTGLHYLGELGKAGSFRKMLKRLDMWDRLTFLELPKDGFAEYHFGGMHFVLPPDKGRFRQVLLDLAPRKRSDIDRFFQILAWAERTMANLGRPKRSIRDKLKVLISLPGIGALAGATYGQILDWVTDDTRLRAALSCLSGEAGLPPSRLSAMVGLLVMAHYLRGAFYPRNGGAGIRDAAVDIIEEQGGRIRTNFEVVRISGKPGRLLVAGRPTKPETDDTEEFEARAVVTAIDPGAWADLFDSSLGLEKHQARARAMHPSVGAFYAFVGLDTDLRTQGWTGRHVAHSDTEDAEAAWRAMLAPTLPESPSMFLFTSPTLKDPQGSYAPPGHTALEVLTMLSYEPWRKWAGKPSRRRGKDYEQLKERFGRALLGKVERYLPELRDHLAFVDFASPLSNEYWVHAPGGGCYGPDQVPGQMGLSRFLPVTPNPGVFLAGAGVLGGGVFTAIRSGELAGLAAHHFLKSKA